MVQTISTLTKLSAVSENDSFPVNDTSEGKDKRVELSDLRESLSTIGTTGQRPNAGDVYIGFQYYDTSINIPVWSDGLNWRNAGGTIV